MFVQLSTFVVLVFYNYDAINTQENADLRDDIYCKFTII